MKLFFAVLLSTPLFIESQEVDAGDILFLKVQELEGEISALRSELESQAYLIDKLLNENQNKVEINNTADTQAQVAENSFRFEGINDGQSIDEVYEQAISQLNDKNFEDAKKMLGARYEKQFAWKNDDETVIAFVEVVERRYL